MDAARESTTTVLYVLSKRDARGIIKFDIDGVAPSAAARHAPDVRARGLDLRVDKCSLYVPNVGVIDAEETTEFRRSWPFQRRVSSHSAVPWALMGLLLRS